MEESQGIQRIRQILGCYPPWYPAKITAEFEPLHIVHVTLLHEPHARWPCPVCHQELDPAGHAPERQFLCLGSDTPKAHIRLRPPLVVCPMHGTQRVTLHWDRDRARWMALRPAAHRDAADSSPIA